jgi:hypothetical protein
MQEEAQETITLLPESENRNISNINFPMHTVLIFKEQPKVNELKESVRPNFINQ